MAIMTKGGYTLERDFVAGDVVKMVSTDPVFKFGAVKTGDIGIIQMVLPDRLIVNFSTQSGWMGKREEFVLVKPVGGFKEGDIVEVITNEPVYGAGSVGNGMVGRVELVNGEELVLNVYGVHPCWSCKEGEVALAKRELKTPSSKFDVGDIVIGNDKNHYAITRKNAYCVVVEVHGNGLISVMTVDGRNDTVYMVKDDMFDYVTTMDDLDREVDKIEEAIKLEREVLEQVADHVKQLEALKQTAQGGGASKKIQKHRIEKGLH